MRTSYSSIETYLQCPQKYKFQEIDRIKTPKSKEAIFGTLIHNSLKFMFQRDPLFPTLDEVINFFRQNWPPKEVFEAETRNDPLKHPWSEDEEKVYFEQGVRMLKKFYEKNAPWNFTIVDLESYFEVAVTDEKTGETHILAGKIDRIDKLDDRNYEIIDYKTAKKMPSQAALEQNLQLSLYSLGLQKRWPHLTAEDIKLSLYFLKHGEKLSAKINSETTEKTKEQLLKTIGEIQNKIQLGKIFEPMPSALCNWCAFRPICPAWKHLYGTNDQLPITNDQIREIIKEFLGLKKKKQESEKRLAELQQIIKEYMKQEGITRVFGDDGIISQKIIQRYEYDWEKIKALLFPIGKWEDILEADEKKLRKIVKEIPENLRREIDDSRILSKEYEVFTVSKEKTGQPVDD